MAIDNKHVRQPQFSSVNDSNIKKFIIDKINDNITKLGTVFHFNTDIKRVDSIEDLPNNADIATIIMVGLEDALEYDEYFFSPNGKWELMGTCKTSLEGITTDAVLYKGSNGLGTVQDPAEGTILYLIYNKFNTLNIQSQLDSITDENTGILKQSKDYSDSIYNEINNRTTMIEDNINSNITDEDIASIVVDKVDDNVSLDKTSLSLNASNITDTITVSRLGTGNITATVDDDTIVSTSVSDNIITVTGLKNGNTTITISIDGDDNYNKPDDIIVSITCSNMPSKTLADNTPEVIKQVSDSGQAANYWSVGDMIPITLSGTVSETSISGTYYATILGINHNSSKEDSTGIDFIIGKDSTGKDIAFCDSNYGQYYSNGGRMVMNTANNNYGGWKSSYMNTNVCPQFLNILPTEWQSVIKNANKYTDNTGYGSNNASNVTLSQSKIWLLSEYEVQGTRTYANSTEQNYQLQYDYYKNGNSKIRYNHSNTSNAVMWWLRSPIYNGLNAFCRVFKDGNTGLVNASYSSGFAPCFRI